jgi:RHS repeat-associated protein
VNPHYQISSSISGQVFRTGETVTYSVTVARVHGHPSGAGGAIILSTGSPTLFKCTGAASCTVNGETSGPLGNDCWSIPAAVSEAFLVYSDPATSWTFQAVFTLDNTTTTCNGVAGYASGSELGESWPIVINGSGLLEYKEDERNEKTICDKIVYGKATAGECPLSYNTANAGEEPASMGWGWTMGYNKFVEEDPSNDDMVFHDGSGSFERWKKLGNGSYVPRYADNYATLTNNGTDPVVITTKDMRILTFRTSDGKIDTEVDRNGNTITYDYDGYARLSSVSDGEGRVIYLEYASPSHLQPRGIRRQDASTGRLTGYDYNGNGRLWKITTPEGDVTEFLYDGNNLLWKKIDPRGNVVAEYTYDNGKVATETRNGELLLTYTYDTGENDSKIVTIVEEDLTMDPEPRTTVLTFDRHSNLVKKVDPLGNVWVFNYEDHLNPYLLTRVTDPNGHVMEYDFDSSGNPISVIDAQGNETTMSYTDDYLLESIQRPTVTVEGNPVTYNPTVLGYDANGNLETIEDTLDGIPVVTTFTYFGDGRVESITNRSGQTTEFEYSTQGGGLNAGNLKKIILPTGPNSAPREIVFDYNAYDERIKATDPAGNFVEYAFDDDGRLEIFTDALQVDTAFHYLDGLMEYVALPENQGSGAGNVRPTRVTRDGPGRVLQVLSKIGTGVNDEQLRVKYVYDGRSNLKEIIRLKRDTNHDPVEKAHEFHYDILNRPFEALDPMSGLAVTHYDPYCKNFTTTSPRGVKTRVMRDSLCRVTQVATNDEKREFFYDELSRLVTVVQTHNPPAVYDDPENLPEDRPPARYGFSRYGDVSTSETIHYLYDELNRLVKITYPDNGNKTVLYEYDGDGRVTKVTDILEHVTEYSYYNDGRLYQVTAKNGGGDQVFTYSYDLAGRPYEIQYPSASGVVAKFYDASNNSGWDANGRLTCLRYMKKDTPPLPDIPILSFEYTYDPSGNRTQWVETPASGPSITWDYEYDWLDRLVSVSKDTIQQSVYVYDESDNRIELQLPVLGDTHTYRYDFADRILERLVDSTPTETFEHDADGNMIARTFGGATTYYKWDNSDKLTSIKRVSFDESYQYDTEGLRKSKGEDARYVSSGALSLADQLPSNSISYIQGHQLLGMLQGGNYYWYISDGLGTVRLVVSSNGTTSSTYAGDEFGRQTAVSGSAGLRQHTYVGALGVRNEVATNSELLLMGQRYYDPTLGRFLSQDPIGFAGGWNLYTYVGNSPVDRVDPSGLKPQADLEAQDAQDLALWNQKARVIGLLRDACFNEEADLVEYYQANSLSNWLPAGTAGFTNPITLGTSVRGGYTDIEAMTTSVHEAYHTRQGRVRLILEGVLAKVLRRPMAEYSQEAEIYRQEAQFIEDYVSRKGNCLTSADKDALNRRLLWIRTQKLPHLEGQFNDWGF